MDLVASSWALIEKGGILAVFLLIIGGLIWERKRLVEDLRRTYAKRDRWRLAYTIVKAAADQAGAKYDLREVDDVLKEDAEVA